MPSHGRASKILIFTLTGMLRSIERTYERSATTTVPPARADATRTRTETARALERATPATH